MQLWGKLLKNFYLIEYDYTGSATWMQYACYYKLFQWWIWGGTKLLWTTSVSIKMIQAISVWSRLKLTYVLLGHVGWMRYRSSSNPSILGLRWASLAFRPICCSSRMVKSQPVTVPTGGWNPFSIYKTIQNNPSYSYWYKYSEFENKYLLGTVLYSCMLIIKWELSS